jgi:hypothetical protein
MLLFHPNSLLELQLEFQLGQQQQQQLKPCLARFRHGKNYYSTVVDADADADFWTDGE